MSLPDLFAAAIIAAAFVPLILASALAVWVVTR